MSTPIFSSSGNSFRHDRDGTRLSEHDGAAVDALFGNGFGEVSDTAPNSLEATKLRSLVGMLALPDDLIAEGRELTIELTLARVLSAERTRTANAAGGSFVDGDLSPGDDDALEALIEAGLDVGRVPTSLRARAARQLALLSALDGPAPSSADRDTLVARTLGGIQSAIERDEARFEVASGSAQSQGMGWRPRFRIGDLVTAAAMLLIGFGVLAPIANGVQGYSRRMDCQTNMSAAGLGFGLYANSNKDALPMATPSPAGRLWWGVGKGEEQSNAANLYMLARTGNARLADLACAGNARAIAADCPEDSRDWGCIEEVSYSYQNLFAAERPNWNGMRTIVIVDRSPVILRAVKGRPIDPVENSPNHGGRGQAALYNDGSVEWLRSPVLQSGDNIWLPRRVEQIIRELTRPRAADPLRGTESPEGADDVFVGP